MGNDYGRIQLVKQYFMCINGGSLAIHRHRLLLSMPKICKYKTNASKETFFKSFHRDDLLRRRCCLSYCCLGYKQDIRRLQNLSWHCSFAQGSPCQMHWGRCPRKSHRADPWAGFQRLEASCKECNGIPSMQWYHTKTASLRSDHITLQPMLLGAWYWDNLQFMQRRNKVFLANNL